jgi:hypothetical protein
LGGGTTESVRANTASKRCQPRLDSLPDVLTRWGRRLKSSLKPSNPDI